MRIETETDGGLNEKEAGRGCDEREVEVDKVKARERTDGDANA